MNRRERRMTESVSSRSHPDGRWLGCMIRSYGPPKSPRGLLEDELFGMSKILQSSLYRIRRLLSFFACAFNVLAHAADSVATK